MSEVRIVIYSLGLNVAVHPNRAKSIHFHLFGEYKLSRLFDNEIRRLGPARVTISDDVENVDNIARIHRLENHHTFFGDPSKIMESVFFSPIWTPTTLRSLSQTGGWDPHNDPLQASIDFSNDSAYECFISEISKFCSAVIERGRAFSETDGIAFISSHVILIVDDLEKFIEQVSKFRIKGGGFQEDDVQRMEVNFYDPPHDLVIPYVHLGLLPLNCIAFESEVLFSLIENESTNDNLDYVVPRGVREKIEKIRDRTMESEIYQLIGSELNILIDCYHTLVQSISDLDNPDVSQANKLQNLIELNNSLDFYQLSISLMKEHTSEYISSQELDRLDQKFSKVEGTLKNRINLEKMQIDLVGNSALKPNDTMPKGMVTKPGEEFKAYAKVLEIISSAAGYLKVVDPYPNVTTFVALARAPEGLSVRFLTVRPRRQNRLSEFEVLVKKLMCEKPEIEVRSAPPSMLHDRFILSKDGSWSLGQSIKDIGNKLSLISPLLKADAMELEKQFDTLWDMSEPAAKS